MIRMMQVNDVNDVNATAVPAGCWNAALVALVAQVAQVAQADPLGTHLVAEEFHVPTGAKEPLRLAESSFGRQRWALHALLLPRQDLGPLGLADLHLHCSAESLMPYSDCEAVPVVLVAPYCHQVDQAHVEYGSVLQWKQSTPNVRQSALPSQAQKGRLQLSGKQLPLQCVPC